ncbi:MAG TPA: AbrB/MazE/SpoVT family DNA-binding domain-containing protein [Rhizomicrobium sp.]|jgi:putative addiction module antidote|nr:AbrB/MazE/SpoVT family DNA-binding domain-containing protein [Rhizomicrobium sp.]
MHFKLKLIQIGNSVGVTLPKEVLAAMKVDKGDTITMTSAPDGFRVTPYDADKSSQMELMRQVMKKRRNALRELAK